MAPVRALIAFVLAAAALAAAPARAQPVTSPGPDSVGVTIYRDPERDAGDRPDLAWLRGYALITEKRTVAIPAGRAVIRFEGVAGGILPESAIIAGLPEGAREKNLDADLLSPRSLYAHSLGRPVTIRRTVGGKATEERAIIRSGPDGAAVLETRDGVIAVDCGGSESLVYDNVPAGLSARPTLSVETDSARAQTVTLTLSYLAWGFDWQADYVATMRPDGKSADLFAWVTLANSDVTSFADAETMVVAGEVHREDSAPAGDRFAEDEPFEFQCLSLPPQPPAPPALFVPAPEPVVVTAARVPMLANSLPAAAVTVEHVAVGDLHAYRVPHPTTVAAKSQKQVALLVRESVPVDVAYRGLIYGNVVVVTVLLRAQNRADKGLGVPLPAGNVAVFEPQGVSRVLVGEGSVEDKAVGEQVEIEVGTATQVAARIETTARSRDWVEQRIIVTNANRFPVRYEEVIYPARVFDDGTNPRIVQSNPRLGRKNGNPFWAVEVPANGTATLVYRTRDKQRSAR